MAAAGTRNTQRNGRAVAIFSLHAARQGAYVFRRLVTRCCGLAWGHGWVLAGGCMRCQCALTGRGGMCRPGFARAAAFAIPAVGACLWGKQVECAASVPCTQRSPVCASAPDGRVLRWLGCLRVWRYLPHHDGRLHPSPAPLPCGLLPYLLGTCHSRKADSASAHWHTRIALLRAGCNPIRWVQATGLGRTTHRISS